MGAGTVNDAIKLIIGPAGAVVVLTFFVLFLLAVGWGLHKGWWVPGSMYTDLLNRNTRLQERFDRVVDVATEGTRLSSVLVERVVDQHHKPSSKQQSSERIRPATRPDRSRAARRYQAKHP